MKSREKIAKEFQKRLSITQGKLSRQFRNTKKCQSFYSGDIMDYEDQVTVADQAGRKKKVLVKFNKVKPYVNAVKGFMAQNRRVQKYQARLKNNEAQELFSKYANSIAKYIRNNADADAVETQQDGDMLICGYGAVETALGFGEGYAVTDEDGQVIMGRLDPKSVGWDPYARATNLTDARWVYSCKEYDLDMAKKLFNDDDADHFEQAVEDDPGAYQYFPNGGAYDKIAQYDYADEEENMVKVYFYQWYDIEPYYRTANPLYLLEMPNALEFAKGFMQELGEEYRDFNPEAEIITFDKEIKGKLEEYFGDFLEEMFEFNRKVFYTAIISGHHVFSSYKSISQQGFTIQFKTGDFDESKKIWTGMINGMIDPMLYYNKALTELMFTIAANSKGGVFYEEDAVDDIQEFETNYAKTDAAIRVNSGALQGNKIREKKSPHVNTGLENIVNIADAALPDVSGIDPSFLGSREFANDTHAFHRARIKRVMSVLACYFDAERLFKKRHARVLLDMMKVFAENNEGMSIRVLDDQSQAMFVNLSKGQLSAEFDVTIEDAPMSEEDRMQQAEILISMGDKVAMTDPKSSKILYGLAIDLMPLDNDMKDKAKEVMIPESNEVDPAYVKQLEAQVKQLMSAREQAQLAETSSKVQKNLAEVEETLSKVKKHMAEADQTEADTDKTAAETAKTLEEAKNKGLENQILESGSYTDASVNI